MGRWRYRVEGAILDKTPPEVAAWLVAELGKLPERFRIESHGHTDLDEIIDWLNDCTGASTEDEVNGVLRELYDWADSAKLWLYLTHEPPKGAQ